MSKTITLPAKKTLSTKEYQKGAEGRSEEQLLPTEGKAPEQKLMHISIETYVASLQTALASAKYALNMQLAVSIAVFHEHGGATRSAKRFLYQVYDKAGWNCATPEDVGYKSVSRRVFSASLLYQHLGAERIDEEIAGAVEGQLITALVGMLAPMNITSVDNLLLQVGKPRLTAAKAAPTQIEGEKEGGEPEKIALQANAELEPGEIVLNEPVKSEEHLDKELPDDVQGPRWQRRLEDIEGVKHLDSDHVHINIAPAADKAEVTRMALALLTLAESMNGHDKAPEPEIEKPLQAELRNIPEPMKKPKGRRVITR